MRRRMLGVTLTSHVGRSSQRACQPPSSSCSSRMPGNSSAAMPYPTHRRRPRRARRRPCRAVPHRLAGPSTLVTSNVGPADAAARSAAPSPRASTSRRQPVATAPRPHRPPARSRGARHDDRLRPARGPAAGSAGSRRGSRPPARTRAAWPPRASRPPSGRRASRPRARCRARSSVTTAAPCV